MTGVIDTRDLRNALGVFATGVTVVTTRDAAGRPRGFTANSFTSVSLEPPLVLVCLARTMGAAPAFLEAGRFAVNILAAEQQAVSAAFGSSTGRRFDAEAVACRDGRTTSPILEGVAAWLECETHDTIEQGDHVILVGRVLDYAYTTAAPLGFCRGTYMPLGLARDALNAAQEPGPVRIGAIVEHDGAVYLERGASGALLLPTAARLGDAGQPGTLTGRLHGAGLRLELSFIYAVFEDEQGAQCIFYRGEAQAPPASLRDRFVPFDAIDWPRLPDDAVRTMLRRFTAERLQNAFGIYVGNHRSGTVRALSPQQRATGVSE